MNIQKAGQFERYLYIFKKTRSISMSMIEKIWRNLSQILYHRNDLIGIIKPFFENLKNKKIKDKKYIPFLKTISIYQLKNLHQHKKTGRRN